MKNISIYVRENPGSDAKMDLKPSKRDIFENEMVPHMAALYNFALRTTNHSDDAKDLVQETYMRAYRYLDKFEPGTNAKAWLFRIMKNTYINQYRKESKEPAKIDYDDVKDIYVSIKDFRTVVILCDIEGYTYEEIGDFIEIPVGTVRSRLHRGRKILRSILRSYAVAHGFNDSKDEVIETHALSISRVRTKQMT